jgi:hypothetical protein
LSRYGGGSTPLAKSSLRISEREPETTAAEKLVPMDIAGPIGNKEALSPGANKVWFLIDGLWILLPDVLLSIVRTFDTRSTVFKTAEAPLCKILAIWRFRDGGIFYPERVRRPVIDFPEAEQTTRF